ncbi:helix-turn-helix domain-containing protein [Phycisphaerales bacterium AB-hyl4]|uniref:Helix-turn-helix domain-containing protein n=1 Tax=Natronomicrosphaera hydrolytica TaxID=3242702 RepID=A0ABV4U535_9BACT
MAASTLSRGGRGSEAGEASASRGEAALRDLCGRLFYEPSRLAQTLTHAITEPFHIAGHVHTDVLQLDLLVGCAGEAWLDDCAVGPLEGLTALVAYPGQRHGYRLEPGPHGGGRVYHLKLTLEPSEAVVRERLFAGPVTGLGSNAPLVAAFRAVTRLGLVAPTGSSPLLLVRLAELLCLWPSDATEAGAYGTPLDSADQQQLDDRLSGAFELVEQRLSDPPTLDELASVAHLSPRHFARRFRQLCGCTPHAYVTARRFALARQLLTQDQLKISHVADALGFGSVATFSRWFTQHAGVNPSQYRQDPTVM